MIKSFLFRLVWLRFGGVAVDIILVRMGPGPISMSLSAVCGEACRVTGSE